MESSPRLARAASSSLLLAATAGAGNGAADPAGDVRGPGFSGSGGSSSGTTALAALRRTVRARIPPLLRCRSVQVGVATVVGVVLTALVMDRGPRAEALRLKVVQV